MNYCGVDQTPFDQRRQGLGADTSRRERFRQERVLRFDGAYRSKAENHSVGRNQAVVELLCYLSLLSNANAIAQTAAITWDKAHVQSISASTGGQVGAHALPCQILIAGQRPSEIALPREFDGDKLRHNLRQLFGKVTVLPKIFNMADSRAEDNCLRGSLVAACISVISETKPAQRSAGVLRRGKGLDHGMIELTRSALPAAVRGAGIDHDAVRAAYTVWSNQARAAFGRTITVVEQRGSVMAGEDVSDEVIYILERYRDSLKRRPAKLGDRQMYDLEESLWA